ncbi:MAG TPA: hypothetical protein VM451_10005 [Candidatus Limnocylindria bacterium]|nr:hypothetical protein [Candidatus Limnocylindria bacterium]
MDLDVERIFLEYARRYMAGDAEAVATDQYAAGASAHWRGPWTRFVHLASALLTSNRRDAMGLPM